MKPLLILFSFLLISLQDIFTIPDKTVNTNYPIIIDISYSGWTTPVGIPDPLFGITQTSDMYVGKLYNYGSGSEPYKNAGNGPYTHYVDKNDPNATDDDNPFGTKTIPRKTIPSYLSPGSVVELHGGPYSYTSIAGKLLFESDGTAEEPVFIRGVDNPVFNVEIFPQGTYMILENIFFDHYGAIGLRPINLRKVEHITIRNCEMNGSGLPSAGAAVQILGTNIYQVSNIVLYDNLIHHQGDSECAEENDRHGINIPSYAENIWILNNTIHHNGGDSIQAAHNGNFTVHHIYIAGNNLHDDRENAVDIKEATDVIISQNKMYGYENGDAMVVHYNSSNVWALFNLIYSGGGGIVSSGSSGLYIIGNIIKETEQWSWESHAPDSPYRSGAGIRIYNSDNFHIVNNTIYDTDVGISLRLTDTTNLSVTNNIISSVTNIDGYHFIIDGSHDGSKIHHNLLYQNNNIRIAGNAGSYMEGDPQFLNPPINFHLLDSSPAIDTGINSDVYSTFENLYSRYISVDYDIKPRPTNQYDIGAFEHD